MTVDLQNNAALTKNTKVTEQPSSNSKIVSVLIIVFFAVLLGAPMLYYGPLVDGHDAHEHLNFIAHFSEQFWHGDLYPRWLMDMNKGLGSPTYFVFPPLPAYVCVLLEPVAHVLHFNAFNFAAFLALLISGLTAYLWLSTFASDKVAMIGSILYMLAPYHLAIDFYRRCALPECWAIAWMPLILYFTAGVIKQNRRSMLGLAIAFALMIFSHLISVAMFFLIPIILAFLVSPAERKLKSVIDVIASMALGTGLSAVYLFAGLENARYIPASKIVNVFRWSENLVSFGRQLFNHSNAENFVQTVAWTVVSMVVVVAICAFTLLRWGGKESKSLVIFWSVFVCGGSVFMVSNFSAPLWRHIHKLPEAIQFPWRFNGVLCLGAIWLIAMFFMKFNDFPRVPAMIASLGLFVVFGAWMFSYMNIWHRYKVDVWQPPHDEQHLVSDSDGWFAAWLPEDTNQRISLQASLGPKARFKGGEGNVQVLDWSPRHILVETKTPADGWVMLNQFYYPTWRASFSGRKEPLTLRTAMPEGLLEVKVPSGDRKILVEIPTSFAERLGQWTSILCALFCLLLVGFSRSHTTANKGAKTVPAIA